MSSKVCIADQYHDVLRVRWSNLLVHSSQTCYSKMDKMRLNAMKGTRVGPQMGKTWHRDLLMITAQNPQSLGCRRCPNERMLALGLSACAFKWLCPLLAVLSAPVLSSGCTFRCSYSLLASLSAPGQASAYLYAYASTSAPMDASRYGPASVAHLLEPSYLECWSALRADLPPAAAAAVAALQFAADADAARTLFCLRPMDAEGPAQSDSEHRCLPTAAE